MSASLLSGGNAPSSVAQVPQVSANGLGVNGVSPAAANAVPGGTVSTSLVIQQVTGVQAGDFTSSQITFIEPPFAVFADVTNTNQSSFVITCPNQTGGGLNEGTLQMYSYASGTANSPVFKIPKPTVVANTGDNLVELVGTDQAGVVTILAGQLAPASPVLNASINPNTPIQFCYSSYQTALGPPIVYGTTPTVTIVALTSFTFTVPVAPLGPITIRWFIPRY